MDYWTSLLWYDIILFKLNCKSLLITFLLFISGKSTLARAECRSAITRVLNVFYNLKCTQYTNDIVNNYYNLCVVITSLYILLMHIQLESS